MQLAQACVHQERTHLLALHRVLIVPAVSPLLLEARLALHVPRHQPLVLLVNTCLDPLVCNAQLEATRAPLPLMAHPALFVHLVSLRALQAAH